MRTRTQERFRRALLAALLVGLATCCLSVTALAQGKTKSTQTEADWISYDPEGGTITVKVRKPGRGPDAKKLKKNKRVVFNVKARG